MAILDILYYPDEKLREKNTDITEFNHELEVTVENMFETMYDAQGVGLAAPQVNLHINLVVIDVEQNNDPKNQIVLINPIITSKEGTTNEIEGCLSVPELRSNVVRAEKVTVKAQNIKGEFFELSADGLLAKCIQHELDHLEGKLFIDYLSPLKKNLYRKKAEKLARNRSRNKAQ